MSEIEKLNQMTTRPIDDRVIAAMVPNESAGNAGNVVGRLPAFMLVDFGGRRRATPLAGGTGW